MSYDYIVGENGMIYGSSNSKRFDRKNIQLNDKDKRFIVYVMNDLHGESRYGIETISELQREYGTSFMVKLLNGIINLKANADTIINNRTQERDNMVQANEQLIVRVQQLEAQNQLLVSELEHMKQELLSAGNVKAVKASINKENINEKVLELFAAGYSQRRIALELSISPGRVSNIIKLYGQQ